LRNKKNPKIPIVYFISKNPIHVERDRNINRKKRKSSIKMIYPTKGR
jgi:hypothetical protein